MHKQCLPTVVYLTQRPGRRMPTGQETRAAAVSELGSEVLQTPLRAAWVLWCGATSGKTVVWLCLRRFLVTVIAKVNVASRATHCRQAVSWTMAPF